MKGSNAPRKRIFPCRFRRRMDYYGIEVGGVYEEDVCGEGLNAVVPNYFSRQSKPQPVSGRNLSPLSSQMAK